MGYTGRSAGSERLSPAVAAAYSKPAVYSPADEAEGPQIIDVEYNEAKKRTIAPMRLLIALLSLMLLAAVIFVFRDRLPLPQNATVRTMTGYMEERVAKLHEWVGGSDYKPPESTRLWATAFVDDYNVPQVDGVGRLFYTVINARDYTCYKMKEHNLAEFTLDNYELSELCDTLKAAGVAARGSITYKDDTGKRLAVYTYIPEYKWLILLDGTKE